MINLPLTKREAAVVQEALSAASDARLTELTAAQYALLWTIMSRLFDLQKPSQEDREAERIDILNRIERL